MAAPSATTDGPHAVQAIRQEEQDGLAFAFRVRSLALAAITLWLLFIVPFPRVCFYLAAAGIFLLLGLIPYLLRKRASGTLWKAMFITLDVALLTYILYVPNPLSENDWPLQMRLRFHDFIYLLVYLASMALSYSPAMVLWAGAASAVCWSIGYWWILGLPDTMNYDTAAAQGIPVKTAADQLAVFLNPYYAASGLLHNQIVLLIIITLVLAAGVWRARRHLKRQVAAEAARANLARYFSPNMVSELASATIDLDTGRHRTVGVLFVDIVGFSRHAERLTPEGTINLLRSFHRRMAKVIFRNGGTIDKYLGDGIMAVFGTPSARPDDARRALACAAEMLGEVAKWSAKRAARDLPPVAIGVGLHYGPVVVGNVGDTRHLEFTVVGDSVNIAARLERLTREASVSVAFSRELVTAVRAQAGERAVDAMDVRPYGLVTLRGRATPVEVWVMG
ncbi:MAG: adenylate/guanylate cyclase domain-containing protein [Dongiaceae bacterium]